MTDLKITTTVDDVDEVTASVEELKVYPIERDPIACAKIDDMQRVIDVMSGGYILDTFTAEININHVENNYNCMDDLGNLLNSAEDLDGWTKFLTKPIEVLGKIGCLNIDSFAVFDTLTDAQIRLHYYNGDIHRCVVGITLIKNGQVCTNSPIVFDSDTTHIRIEGLYKLTGPASKPIFKYIPSAIDYYKKSNDTYLSVSNAEIKYQNSQKTNSNVELSESYDDNGTTLSKIGNTVMLCLCIDGEGVTIGNISDDKFKPTEIVQQRIDSTSVIIVAPNGSIKITGNTGAKEIVETITYLAN